jgi:benzodiazapine receptor
MSTPTPTIDRSASRGRMLLGFVAATTAAALFAAAQEPGPWYGSLAKPWWAPAPEVFEAAGRALPALVAAAGFLAWRAAPSVRAARLVLAAWLAQLALGVVAAFALFGLHRPLLALAALALQLFAIAACIPIFAKGSRLAAWLFVPAAAWVSFLGTLTAALWSLNR